jgi:hypothetical protein
MKLSIVDMIALAAVAVLAILTISEFAAATEEAGSREPAKAFWTESAPSAACMPAKPKPRKHVKRKAKAPAPTPTPVVVTKEVVREVVVEKLVSAPVRRNRLDLLVGAAPYMGGVINALPSKVVLDNRSYYPAAGVGFSRTFSEQSRWSWGVEGFTNLSGFLKLGYGF